jgi:hypothetical protein
MARKNLATETMVSLSSAWVDAKRERPLLEAHPLTAGLLPAIEGAHKGVVEALKPAVPQPVDTELTKLQAQALATDQQHDHKVRGVWYFHTAMSELTEEPNVAAWWLDLRDRLLPNGLATTSMAYAAEAGNAEAVKQRLDPQTRAALKKWKTLEGRTLDDEVAAWLKSGIALGPLDARRLALIAKRDGELATTTPVGGANRARNVWINTANALVTNVALVDALTDAERSRILGPMEAAEAKADRRGARKQAEPSPEPQTPAPAASDANKK